MCFATIACAINLAPFPQELGKNGLAWPTVTYSAMLLNYYYSRSVTDTVAVSLSL